MEAEVEVENPPGWAGHGPPLLALFRARPSRDSREGGEGLGVRS